MIVIIRPAFLFALALAGCGGASPVAAVPESSGGAALTCDDAAANANKLRITLAVGGMRSPPARSADAVFLLGQSAAEPEGLDLDDEAPGDVAPTRSVSVRSRCVDDRWSVATIRCFATATTVATATTCIQNEGLGTVVSAGGGGAAASPACNAAANTAAEAIASDAKVAPERREALLAKVRAAILEPCLAGVISAGLLDCLTRNHENFGICGFDGGADWDAVKKSLEAQGFGPKKR